MKKRFEEWLKLTGDNNSRSANASVTPIRMLDLRGFQEMEDKLLIYMPRRGELPPDVEEFVDDLSKRTFGVTRNDTLFKVPAGYDDLPLWSDERQNIDDRYTTLTRASLRQQTRPTMRLSQCCYGSGSTSGMLKPNRYYALSFSVVRRRPPPNESWAKCRTEIRQI